MSDSKNIQINKVILSPSIGEHSIVPNLYSWRTEKKFIGPNLICIGDPQEPIWWNRPITSDAMCKLEANGIYSYNLPLCPRDNQRLLFKCNYNILVNKNSVPYAVNIKVDDSWTEEQKQLLPKMMYNCSLKTLTDLGVNRADLSNRGNDLYFQGRKFACSEHLFEENVFTQDAIITLLVNPEADLFNQLTGKYAHKKTITGISEEVPEVTKQAFIDKLYENVSIYLEEHFN